MSTTIEHPPVNLSEPFWRYKGDWRTKQTRTDTPDLMELFNLAANVQQDQLLAEGAAELADENLEIAVETFDVQIEALPAE